MGWAVRVVGVIAVLVAAALLGPAGARAAGPLTWSAPGSLESTSNGTPTSIACPSSDLCVIGDDAGFVLSTRQPTRGPAAWTGAAIDASTAGRHAITGLACPTSSLCIGVDDAGAVLTTTHPTGPASRWKRTVIDSVSAFTGISCASATSCVAVDEAGNAWSTQSPTGGRAAWTKTATGATDLTAVSCSRDGFCAAVDDAGDVLTDTSADGTPTTGTSTTTGTWAQTNLTSQPLDAVACASATLCLVGGKKTGLFVSSTPTGGATAWRVEKINPSAGSATHVLSLACSAASSCAAGVVGGGWYTTAHPLANNWTAFKEYSGNYQAPIAISCPPASKCFGVGRGGDTVGFRAHGYFVNYIDGPQSDLVGVSCPTARQCFTADDGGEVLFSTAPAANENAWTVEAPTPGGGIDGDGNEPYSLTCASVSLCLTGFGYEQRGDAGESLAELGGYSTAPDSHKPWHQFKLPGHGFNVPACNTASLCVVSNDKGATYGTADPAQPKSWHPVATRNGIYCVAKGDCVGENASCPTRTRCVQAGGKGVIEVWKSPASNKVSRKLLMVDAGHYLTGVACPTAGLCYAVDDAGHVLVSTRPQVKASWKIVDNVDTPLTGISCPTTKLCVAVGNDSTAVIGSR